MRAGRRGLLGVTLLYGNTRAPCLPPAIIFLAIAFGACVGVLVSRYRAGMVGTSNRLWAQCASRNVDEDYDIVAGIAFDNLSLSECQNYPKDTSAKHTRASVRVLRQRDTSNRRRTRTKMEFRACSARDTHATPRQRRLEDSPVNVSENVSATRID